MMDLMVDVSRRAAVAVSVAAVLGAAAVSLLHRRLLRMPVHTAPDAAAGPAASPGERRAEVNGEARAPTEDRSEGDPPPDGEPDRVEGSIVEADAAAARSNVRSFVRKGLTATVVVLIALAAGAFAYASWIHPDTAVPQPGSSSIEVDFSPGHSAHSPVTVGVRLILDQSASNGGSPVTLAIDVAGEDLTHAGWSVHALVPAGVSVNGALDNDPRTGEVYPLSGGQEGVYIAPGPVRQGAYTALLEWNDLTSGPIQVVGPNLVAVFPDVTVINQSPVNSTGGSSEPTPPLTISQTLFPGADFAFLGGLPPDLTRGGTWSWKPSTGLVNDPALALPFEVEARSPTADQQSNNREFQSGIFFGVAAAAAIAAIQEFINSARRKERNAPG
jgi:hypothetical protein